MRDLVEREGLFYKKFTDVPFTAEVTGEYQGSFRNWMKQGSLIVYHENGQLWFKVTYKSGKEDGAGVEYHDNGRLFRKGTYKDGKMHGPWVRYHENGELAVEGSFRDGEFDGPWVSYEEDGTINLGLTGTFKNGVKVN